MSRPNLLIITTDQHRGDCYGFEGRKVKTPHIDQLAAAGTRFQHCITPSAMCQPARASMLTGLYPLTHGVVDNGIDLPPETGDAGFAGQLGRNGYHTAFIGKAHFSSYNTFSPTGTPECHQSSPNFSDDWNGPYMGFEEAQLLVLGHELKEMASAPKGLHYERWLRRDGQGQKKLGQAKVLLIGLGGIGSTVLQHLAAAGIGKIGLVDQDTVALSNLQRQTIYTFEDIGRKKVSVASNFVKNLNKNVDISEYDFFLNANNSTSVIGEYDIVLDGTDNVESRELINQHCVKLGKPLIFGGVSGWEGLVSLLVYKNSACFSCIFTNSEKRPAFFDCSSEGVLGVTTSLVGTLMVAETIKLICNTGQLLTNKLLICDALSGVTEILNVQKNEQCNVCQPDN